MTDAANMPHLPPPCPADEADWARALVLRQLEMLGELAELGLEVARAIEGQAAGRSPAPVIQGDVGLAYSRVSRSVRQTIHLQSTLIEGLKGEDAAARRARAEAKDEPDRFSPQCRRKASVERIVERLAEAGRPDSEDDVTELLMDAAERLDDEDLYGDLLDRPLSELVERICRDLGLRPDWAALAQEFWARREIESGAPGWPLARLTAPPAGGGEEPPAGEPMVERPRHPSPFPTPTPRNSS